MSSFEINCSSLRRWLWRGSACVPTVAALLAVSACLPAPSESKPPESVQVNAGALPASVDLAPVAWRPGLAMYALDVAGQAQRSVAVWVPDTDRPRSIVVNSRRMKIESNVM